MKKVCGASGAAALVRTKEKLPLLAVLVATAVQADKGEGRLVHISKVQVALVVALFTVNTRLLPAKVMLLKIGARTAGVGTGMV